MSLDNIDLRHLFSNLWENAWQIGANSAIQMTWLLSHFSVMIQSGGHLGDREQSE